MEALQPCLPSRGGRLRVLIIMRPLTTAVELTFNAVARSKPARRLPRICLCLRRPMHSQRGYSVHRRHLEQQSYMEKTQPRYLKRLLVPEEIRYREPTKSSASAIYIRQLR